MAGVRWGERRILRRASHESLKVAIFRDQPFDAPSQHTLADSYAHGDWAADYRRAEHAQNGDTDDDTGPLTVIRDVAPQAPARPEDVSWDEASRMEQRPLPPDTLTFKPAARPWYGSQRILMLIVGFAIVVMIVAGVLLALRSSSGGSEDSTTVTPTATSSAAPPPPPSDTVGDDPLPPAEVPAPPPPPPDDPTAPPRGNGGYTWTPSHGSETTAARPRESVPISVAPLPHTAPAPGHSAPGDAPKHRGFFG